MPHTSAHMVITPPPTSHVTHTHTHPILPPRPNDSPGHSVSLHQPSYFEWTPFNHVSSCVCMCAVPQRTVDFLFTSTVTVLLKKTFPT